MVDKPYLKLAPPLPELQQTDGTTPVGSAFHSGGGGIHFSKHCCPVKNCRVRMVRVTYNKDRPRVSSCGCGHSHGAGHSHGGSGHSHGGAGHSHGGAGDSHGDRTFGRKSVNRQRIWGSCSSASARSFVNASATHKNYRRAASCMHRRNGRRGCMIDNVLYSIGTIPLPTGHMCDICERPLNDDEVFSRCTTHDRDFCSRHGEGERAARLVNPHSKRGVKATALCIEKSHKIDLAELVQENIYSFLSITLKGFSVGNKNPRCVGRAAS